MTIPSRTPPLVFTPSALDLSGVMHRLQPLSSVDAILVHCSATPPSADWDVVTVDRVHRQRGFTCVGYHFVIKRNGDIQVGRPAGRMGAHCRDQGYNRRSLGICLIGGVSENPQPHVPGSPWNGSNAEANFTDEQMKSLDILVNHLVAAHDVPVKGHRDVRGVRKACPSFNVGTWLQTGQNPTSVD